MKHIQIFILLFMSGFIQAQTMQGPSGYGTQQDHIAALKFFRPPVLNDTICDLVINATNGDCYGAIVILRSNNKMYRKDSVSWKEVGAGGIARALDSLRYDPATATFYTRYTTGGELAVPTGLVDSLARRIDTLFRRNDTVFVHNQYGTYYIPDNRNYVDVKWFGAIGDSVTNDRAAITAAADFACTNKRDLYFTRGVYNVGNLALYDSVILIRNVNGMTVNGNGSKIVGNSTTTNGNNQSVQPRFIEITNSSQITIKNLRFQDNGYSDALTYRGAHGVYITKGSGDVFNIVLENLHAFKMLSLFGRDYSTSRFENIDIRNCFVERGYYGMILNNPKNMEVSTFRADSVKRAMFLTGGQFVKASIWSYNHQPASAEVLLKCYNIPLKNIDIRYKSDSSKSVGNAFLALEQQTGIDPGGEYLIDNVNINIDCSGSTVGIPVIIRAYDINGTPEATTSKHWDHIRIRGLPPAGLRQRQVQVASVQDLIGSIEVEPALASNNFLSPYFPGFVQKIGDTYNYTVMGPLSSKTQFIDLSRTPGMPQRTGAIKIKTVMLDNTSSQASANVTYQEDVLFVNLSASNVATIISQSNLHKVNTTTGATATYTASGSGINVTFATYTNSLSVAYIIAEPIM